MPKPRPPGAVPLSSLLAAQRPKSSGCSKTLKSAKRQSSSNSVSWRGGGGGAVRRQPVAVQVVREPAAVGDRPLLQERVESRSLSAKDHIISNIACIRYVNVNCSEIHTHKYTYVRMSVMHTYVLAYTDVRIYVQCTYVLYCTECVCVYKYKRYTHDVRTYMIYLYESFCSSFIT